MTKSSTTHVFLLPDVGEGLTEAEIVAWHVQAGDEVQVNQVIVEIETAKSIVELPSPHAGSVANLLASVGDTVPVGQGIIEIVVEGHGDAAGEANAEGPDGTEVRAHAESQPGAEASTTSAVEETAEPKLLVGYGATDLDRVGRRRRATTGPGRQSVAPERAPETSKPRAKPPVRKLAKSLGVDLAAVTASGPDETITREDVQLALQAQEQPQEQKQTLFGGVRNTATGAAGEPTRIPIKGVRKATAEAMVASAFTAPHVTEFITIDVTRTIELRDRLQRRPEFAEIKLTPLALIAQAYLRALARTPMACAAWDEAAQEIVIPGHVNLGIAAATPRGLLVPNIKHAEALGLPELALAINELGSTARNGKTPPADLSGGTTTITNIGVFGIDSGTPILNPGETAILAVGAIARRPWVVEDEQGERIEPRSVLQLALSFDHRVLDGAEGSKLLADTAEVLNEPGLALL